MIRMRHIGFLVAVAAMAFATAFRLRAPRVGTTKVARAATSDPTPDSVRLAAIGLRSGRQLIAYVFVSSRCGSCRRPETKAAIAALRDSLRRNNGDQFPSIHVVGVAVNTDVETGLAYLQSIGLGRFDQISTGDGWQNQHVVNVIWRAHGAEPEAPQIVLATRGMTSTIDPVSAAYTADSVVRVISGFKLMLQWVNAGAHVSPPNSGQESK
jgi:hypothetical protein